MNIRSPRVDASLRPRALAAAALLALPGCGGSVSIGFGYDGRNDRPPSVSLVASADSASVGQSVRLLAAASDDYGVVAVEFYRFDANGATLLATDRNAPYQVDAAVPAASTGAVQFFARAIDDANQRADSDSISITVLP